MPAIDDQPYRRIIGPHITAKSTRAGECPIKISADRFIDASERKYLDVVDNAIYSGDLRDRPLSAALIHSISHFAGKRHSVAADLIIDRIKDLITRQLQ